MSEFTQGEWVYDEPFGVIYSDATNMVIANVPGAGTGSCFCLTPEGQANARLIAAAPEMYRLLDECVDELGATGLSEECYELLNRIDGKEEQS